MATTEPLATRSFDTVERDERIRPAWDRIALWVLVTLIFLFLVVPSLVVVPMSLTPRDILEFPPSGVSLHSFRDFIFDPTWRESTVTSVQVALIAVVLSGIVGVLAAVGLHRATFRGRSLLVGMILLPVATPLVVLGLGFFGFLARLGLVATPWGIGIAHGVLALPYFYLIVSTSLTGLNPALKRAASSLGGGAFAIFRHVYLPVIMPGVIGGALFAFTISFDEVVVAYFLQGPEATTLPVKIYLELQYSLSPVIAAVSTLLLLITTVLLVTQLILMRRRSRVSLVPAGLQTEQ